MKQVIQNLRTGQAEAADVPAPSPRHGQVVIRTTRSLVSPGTERMLRDFGKGNFLEKARQQPDKVRQVLHKVRTDGLMPTLEAVRAKLDQPVPLGYCNVGLVVEAGGADGLQAGDRVVSNGAHAEIVRVPKNLTVRVPDGVDDDTAAFTVLGSIALEGVRLANPTLGECVAVIGLGLVGLLAVQLLRAQGVRVLGIDLDAGRCAMARQSGAETVCIKDGEDPIASALAFSRGRGVDAVLICAATSSNEPILQSAQMARVRGRIVLVGVVGLDVPRDEFFRKELSFQVSCSYGPGRYDPDYEQKGHDYPVGFVRWTAQRNFEAVLDMMADGRLDVRPYISRRVKIDEAPAAYETLGQGGELGILFDYPAPAERPATPTQVTFAGRPSLPGIRMGVIGAGNYATRVLIPALRDGGASPVVVCGSGSIAEVHAAKKFGFARACSQSQDVLDASDVDLVVIATRHDSHAALVRAALERHRPIFVEKPLALNDAELDAVEAAYAAAPSPFLMVGFNRRFSPLVVRLKAALEKTPAPPAIVMTVNAGAVPAAHWAQDPVSGGGRIIGEACHFIDLARHLAGAAIVEHHAVGLGAGAAGNLHDNAVLSLKFANGAIASINYLANGHPRVPKERVEVYSGGRVWSIANFRSMDGFGTAGVGGAVWKGPDKGQAEMSKAVLAALKAGQPAPIPFEELREVARVTIALDRELRQG